MFVRIATAAFIALAASSTALAAGTDGATTIRFQRVDVSDPAAVDALLDRFAGVAKQHCLVTGSLIANRECVDEFVAEAISQVRRPELRAALGQSSTSLSMSTVD